MSVPGAAELDPDPPDPELGGQVATAPTEETTPGVVRLLGRVMLTLSPTAIVVCSEALSATCTWRMVEVPCITVSPARALPPSCADTLVTRTAEGSNTTWPRVSAAVLGHPQGGLQLHHGRGGGRPEGGGPRAELSRVA